MTHVNLILREGEIFLVVGVVACAVVRNLIPFHKEIFCKTGADEIPLLDGDVYNFTLMQGW